MSANPREYGPGADPMAEEWADKPLPDRFRFLLFEDKREVELVWHGKTRGPARPAEAGPAR